MFPYYYEYNIFSQPGCGARQCIIEALRAAKALTVSLVAEADGSVALPLIACFSP